MRSIPIERKAWAFVKNLPGTHQRQKQPTESDANLSTFSSEDKKTLPRSRSYRGCLPSVSRVLLERETEHSDLLARDGVEHASHHQLREASLLVVVHGDDLHASNGNRTAHATIQKGQDIRQDSGFQASTGDVRSKEMRARVGLALELLLSMLNIWTSPESSRREVIHEENEHSRGRTSPPSKKNKLPEDCSDLHPSIDSRDPMQTAQVIRGGYVAQEAPAVKAGADTSGGSSEALGNVADNLLRVLRTWCQYSATSGRPVDSQMYTRLRTSFWKQDPPKPTEALRNLFPIRGS